MFKAGVTVPVDPYYGFYSVSKSRSESISKPYSPYIAPVSYDLNASTELGPAAYTPTGEVIVYNEGKGTVVSQEELKAATTKKLEEKIAKTREEQAFKEKEAFVQSVYGKPSIIYDVMPGEYQREIERKYQDLQTRTLIEEQKRAAISTGGYAGTEGGIPYFAEANYTTDFAYKVETPDEKQQRLANEEFIRKSKEQAQGLPADVAGATMMDTQWIITSKGIKEQKGFVSGPVPSPKFEKKALKEVGDRRVFVSPVPMPTPEAKAYPESVSSSQEFGIGLTKFAEPYLNFLAPKKQDYSYGDLPQYLGRKYVGGFIGGLELLGEGTIKGKPIEAVVAIGESSVQLGKGIRQGAERSYGLFQTGKYEPAFKTALFGVAGTLAELKGASKSIPDVRAGKIEPKYKVEILGEAEIGRTLGYFSGAARDYLFTKEYEFKPSSEYFTNVKPIIEIPERLVGKFTRTTSEIKTFDLGKGLERVVESEGKIVAEQKPITSNLIPEPYGDLLGIKAALKEGKAKESIVFEAQKSTILGGKELVKYPYKPLSTEAAATGAYPSVSFTLNPEKTVLARDQILFPRRIRTEQGGLPSKSFSTPEQGIILEDIVRAKFDIQKYPARILTDSYRYFGREGGFDYSYFTKRQGRLYPIGLAEATRAGLNKRFAGALETYPWEHINPKALAEIEARSKVYEPFKRLRQVGEKKASSEIIGKENKGKGQIQIQIPKIMDQTLGGTLARNRQAIPLQSLRPRIIAPKESVKISEAKLSPME